MEPFLTTLRALAQLAAKPASAGRVVLAAPAAIVASLLGGTPLEHEQAQVMEALAGPPAALEPLAEQVASRLSGAQAERFARAGAALADAQMLAQLLCSPTLRHAALEPSDLAIFDYVERWDLQPEPGAPPTTLVGGLAISGGLQIQLCSEHFAARRTTIGYERQMRTPRLSLSVLSAAPTSAMRGERAGWEQRPGPGYRLQVFTGGRKLAGALETTELALPLTLAGARLSLTLPAVPGVSAVCTAAYDAVGQMLARCIRLWREP